jgi:hypothetical protein
MEFDSSDGYCGRNTTFPTDLGQWIKVDQTAQFADLWHVDDYVGISPGVHGGLQPLEGNQSMWCGIRDGFMPEYTCTYDNLPGYGHNWDQEFISNTCLSVNDTTDVTIAFMMFFDSETHYDYTYLQWDACDEN